MHKEGLEDFLFGANLFFDNSQYEQVIKGHLDLILKDSGVSEDEKIASIKALVEYLSEDAPRKPESRRYFPIFEKYVNNNHFQSLKLLLHTVSPETKLYTLSLMAGLVQCAESIKTDALRAGVIESMVLLFKNTTLDIIKLSTTLVLGNLSAGFNGCKQIIIDADILKPLIHTFKKVKDPKFRLVIIALFNNLAHGASPGIIGYLAGLGFIKPLVKLLGNSDREVQQASVSYIALLTVDNIEQTHQQLVKAGAVKALIKMLKNHQDLHLCLRALTALHGLSRGSVETKKAILDAGILKPLLYVMDVPEISIQVLAVYVLDKLGEGVPKHKKMIIAADVIKPIITLLDSDTLEVQDAAVAAVYWLADRELYIQKAFVAAGVIEPLKRLKMQGASDVIRTTASGLIEAFSPPSQSLTLFQPAQQKNNDASLAYEDIVNAEKVTPV